MRLEEIIDEKESIEGEIKRLLISFQQRTNTKITEIRVDNFLTPDPEHADKFVTRSLYVNLGVEV